MGSPDNRPTGADGPWRGAMVPDRGGNAPEANPPLGGGFVAPTARRRVAWIT